ncbi:Pleckstrin-like plant domain-containing protein [Dioscorea alata]|uniref:Pleckstrin-like plant domain-containing protein n=1 Tax=Dioscorea alata TaxID=55571 RepID=A0ACB7VL92_DIOAL|nr:Pleckstrin-like plant domain-containing protein [Dioscorea alata]
MDGLSDAWCSSAIQVFQPAMAFEENAIMEFRNADNKTVSTKNDKNVTVEDNDFKKIPQWNVEDVKSWLWLQQAIHPELDYDLNFRKKWFSTRNAPWKGMSIKKWMKEMRQKRKEEDRLQKAEVHAAISVAGVAAALATIAAENTAPGQHNASKEAAVATAAALVAAQCAQVAEAVGAKREQLESAISAAITATDKSNIITLTAAAATSLRGAATLRGRPGHRERIKGSSTPTLQFNEHYFDFGRCRASLAKGEELLVRTADGKCRLRLVSVSLNKDAKVILTTRKVSLLIGLSSAQESIVYDLQTSQIEEPAKHPDPSCYSVSMTTTKGRIELEIDDYIQYKKWTMTINQMLILSTTFGTYEFQV